MTVPLVENILAQPEAIRSVTAHQLADGQRVLLQSAALLRSGKRIILSGMGGSFFACIPMSHYLAERGVIAPVVETSELLHFYTPALDESTAVVLVSRSGETVEITKLLPIIKNKATVIGVTNVPESTLGREATQAIFVNSPADQLVAIQTYTGTIVALMLLGAAFFNELNANLRSELDTLATLLSYWVPECFKATESGAWFFQAASPLYLLGRGASLASVGIGVVLCHEVAKASAVGMSSANFRHGPVEVVDDRFHAVIFGSQKLTAELDAALGQDVNRMGGKVRWIGPAMEGYELESLCPWPANVPDRFAPVLEVIPIQIAAYRMAQSTGITPGQFRHAPVITVSETGFATATASHRTS